MTNIKYKEDMSIITIKTTDQKENLLVYYYNSIDFNLGDKIKVDGNLEPLTNNTIFNLFNYKKYMLSKNVYYKSSAHKIKIISKNSNILYDIKKHFLERINRLRGSEYLYTFILGDNSYIDEHVLSSYRINGISHLFSVSGMHITLLSTIIFYLLNKIKKCRLNYISVSIFLLFFTFLTNFTPSVIRATFLFIVLNINKVFNFKIPTYKALIYVLLVNLFINPYSVYNIGFVFSYTISLYLIVFSKIINRHKNYLMKTFITSFISFLASIPILINNYFSINLMTIINNMIFVPLVSIVIFPFSLIVMVIPKIDFIFEKLIYILEKLSLFCANYKVELIMCKANITIIILYVLIITFVLYQILMKKYKYIILILPMLLVHTNINFIKNTLLVTFIDVGQGDSSLIKFPYNNGSVLIDTGGVYNYKLYTNIITYLKSNGIKSIKYLILTHGDYDHMGEAINLVNNFNVENVIFNCGEFNDLENELIKVLDNKGIKYYSCIKELNISKYKLKFLDTREYDNENDNSSVIYFNYNNYKFIFMGDAGITKEKDILDNYNLSNIDFIKIGHHGSNTSSSKYFISNINPKYSLISVGKNNRYGHPKDSVLKLLKNSKIYRTDKHGSIEVRLNRNGYSIKTCDP